MSLATVQKLFSDVFPFLKIEFFEPESKIGGNAALRRRLRSTERILADYRRNGEVQEIKVEPGMSVNELEKRFSNLYKLSTHVFRKSGNVWLETTITDGWSLEEQNQQGEIITLQMNEGR